MPTMSETLLDVIRFAFIFVVPLVMVAGGALTLFGLGAVIYVFEQPKEVADRINGLFRQPEKPPKKLSSTHYYQPYWTRSSSGGSDGS